MIGSWPGFAWFLNLFSAVFLSNEMEVLFFFILFVKWPSIPSEHCDGCAISHPQYEMLSGLLMFARLFIRSFTMRCE